VRLVSKVIQVHKEKKVLRVKQVILVLRVKEDFRGVLV
jgi:hypothetical protein